MTHAIPCSIPVLVENWARRTPDTTALIFEGQSTSYAVLDRETNLLANRLIAAGIEPGDRIAYLGKNSDRYFRLLIAVAKARAILLPLNWRLAQPELEYIVSDAQPKLLFCAEEFLNLAPALQSAGVTGDCISLNALETWTATGSAAPLSPCQTDDVVLLMYTSGTTGRPKGVMISHRSVLRVEDNKPTQDPDWFIWTPGEVALLAMPCFHIGGTGQGLRALKGGATAVILSEFNVDAVLKAVVEYRVSRLFLVPSAIQSVLQHPSIGKADYTCLKYILYGASPIPADLLRQAIDQLGCGFVQMYGATETSGTVIALSPEDHLTGDPTILTSAGRPLPGMDIRIVDAKGKEVATDEAGEILVRGAANMAGYWQLPEETARTIDTQGWLRTGDKGAIDVRGYVRILDRVKDMIISGGENVYPAEIESVIFGHPAVKEVAVIGLPDHKWGEAVAAVIVLHDGQQLDTSTLIAWTREHLAGYKTPKIVHYIDALPRNAAGKILKYQLRDQFTPTLKNKVSA